MNENFYRVNLMVLNLAEMYSEKCTLITGTFDRNKLFIKESILVHNYTKEPAHCIYLNNFKL